MIKNYKPTSAGIRHRKTLVNNVDAVRPLKSLTTHIKGAVGRNNGRISIRFRQVGHRKLYRIIDFKRTKFDIPAKVISIQYDPNRGPNIALVSYLDGEKSYILAPEGLKVGMTIMSSQNRIEAIPGNTMPLSHMPLGQPIHNIEINPGAGGKVARGAGNSAKILAKDGGYVNVKMPSGEVKRFKEDCLATAGVLSNQDLRNTALGKAGISRHKGRRPHIRGVAIANPSDHPHGGSYKDNGVGMPSPKSPWGWKTRGMKTRSRTYTNKFIVKDRRVK